MDAGPQKILEEAGQSAILEKAEELNPEQREALFDQVAYLNGKYPGGLKEYVARAKKLLHDSANNINPFEGFTPSVPSGKSSVDIQVLRLTTRQASRSTV